MVQETLPLSSASLVTLTFIFNPFIYWLVTINRNIENIFNPLRFQSAFLKNEDEQDRSFFLAL